MGQEGAGSQDDACRATPEPLRTLRLQQEPAAQHAQDSTCEWPQNAGRTARLLRREGLRVCRVSVWRGALQVSAQEMGTPLRLVWAQHSESIPKKDIRFRSTSSWRAGGPFDRGELRVQRSSSLHSEALA